MATVDLGDLIAKAKADPERARVDRLVAESGIETWLEPEEKALLFGIGAFARGNGTVVELGAYQGGSACFLAAGLARRGRGRLHSVDPHLGAPPWFGLAPHKRTFATFQRGVEHCGLSRWVRPHLSDSASLAAVWPAEGLDAVLIDGDHSFLGALKDFESWAPKVRPGGLILIDDAGGPIAELNELVDLIRGLSCVADAGQVDGIAAFERKGVEPWDLLDELRGVLAARRVHRPWNYAPLHDAPLPPRYQADGWPSLELSEAYMIAFLARCGPGPYGYTAASRRDDRVVLEALHRDRADGDLIDLDGLGARFRALLGRPDGGFRALLCRPDEAPALAPRLLTGGVLFCRHDLPDSREATLQTRQRLLDAGLSGCGATANFHWGVWQPHRLSPDAVLDYALAATR